MKTILAIILMLGAMLPASASASINDLMMATCKVNCDKGTGSGCGYMIREGFYCVLTAAHVVEGSSVAQCEFWKDGYKSGKIPGQVTVSDTQIDVALIIIPVEAFGDHVPPVIPLGTVNDEPTPGTTIVSMGCAKGAWPTLWKGVVNGHDPSDPCRFLFEPPPAGGRSGSVICDANATKILGIVQVRIDERGEGGAMGIATVVNRMSGKCAEYRKNFKLLPEIAAIKTQYGQPDCGPGGCGPSQSPYSQQPRQYMESQPQSRGQQQNPWPSHLLPYRNEQEKDKDKINKKVDGLESMFSRQQAEQMKLLQDILRRQEENAQSQVPLPPEPSVDEHADTAEDAKGLSPVVAGLVILSAVVLGFVIYFATQKGE